MAKIFVQVTKVKNALGYEVPMTSMTTVVGKPKKKNDLPVDKMRADIQKRIAAASNAGLKSKLIDLRDQFEIKVKHGDPASQGSAAAIYDEIVDRTKDVKNAGPFKVGQPVTIDGKKGKLIKEIPALKGHEEGGSTFMFKEDQTGKTYEVNDHDLQVFNSTKKNGFSDAFSVGDRVKILVGPYQHNNGVIKKLHFIDDFVEVELANGKIIEVGWDDIKANSMKNAREVSGSEKRKMYEWVRSQYHLGHHSKKYIIQTMMKEVGYTEPEATQLFDKIVEKGLNIRTNDGMRESTTDIYPQLKDKTRVSDPSFDKDLKTKNTVDAYHLKDWVKFQVQQADLSPRDVAQLMAKDRDLGWDYNRSLKFVMDVLRSENAGFTKDLAVAERRGASADKKNALRTPEDNDALELASAYLEKGNFKMARHHAQRIGDALVKRLALQQVDQDEAGDRGGHYALRAMMNVTPIDETEGFKQYRKDQAQRFQTMLDEARKTSTGKEQEARVREIMRLARAKGIDKMINADRLKPTDPMSKNKKNDYVQPGDTVIYEPAVRAMRDKEFTGQKATVKRVDGYHVWLDFPGHPNFHTFEEDVHLVNTMNESEARKMNPGKVDEALWDKAKRAAKESGADDKWAFTTWWYKKHGGKFR